MLRKYDESLRNTEIAMNACREVISWGERGLELYPDDLSMIKDLASAYSQLLQGNATPEELHKGLVAMRRAVEAAPSDPVPSLNLAVVLARFDLYIRDYDKRKVGS